MKSSVLFVAKNFSIKRTLTGVAGLTRVSGVEKCGGVVVSRPRML
jgi:hypothetical protein